jgi:ABC-2 type transport system permease protein
MIRALLRAQWLSMRPGRSRGAVFSLITSFIWYGFWSSVSYAAYAFAERADAADLRAGLPATLLAVCLYWQIVPVISGSTGSALDMRKLLVYPVPHDRLFLVEVLLRFTMGTEMVMVLVGGTVGLLSNRAAGAWSAAPQIGGAILVYILFNILLASGLRSLLERLLVQRHVREVLLFLMLLVMTAPRFLIAIGYRPHSAGGWLTAFQIPGLPWSAAATLLLSRDRQGAVALLVLAAWVIVAGWFGRTQFERSLRYDAIAAQATPLGAGPALPPAWPERFYRLPSLVFRDPLAILIEKELRSLFRTPRFRMVFLMGFTFGLMVWLPIVLGKQAQRGGAVQQNFLVVVCVYALALLGQVTYWNCFGFDRSAVQIYFVAPAPVRVVLLAKNVASLIFAYLEVLVLTVLTVVLPVGIGLGKIFETLIVVGICSLYMLALGNVSSVQYPRALKPERVSQGGASGRFQSLVFILYPLALLPVFLAYLARYAFASQTAFVAVLTFAAILGAVLYRIAMESAERTVAKERERILGELSHGEGPIASA